MKKMEYTVSIGSEVLAKFVLQGDAEIFADALHATLVAQDKSHEQISVESSRMVCYIAGEYKRLGEYDLRGYETVGA